MHACNVFISDRKGSHPGLHSEAVHKQTEEMRSSVLHKIRSTQQPIAQRLYDAAKNEYDVLASMAVRHTAICDMESDDDEVRRERETVCESRKQKL